MIIAYLTKQDFFTRLYMSVCETYLNRCNNADLNNLNTASVRHKCVGLPEDRCAMLIAKLYAKCQVVYAKYLSLFIYLYFNVIFQPAWAN